MIVAPWQLREQFVSPDAGEIMGLTFLADKPSQVTAEMSEMIQEAGIGTDYTPVSYTHLIWRPVRTAAAGICG